MGAPLQSFDMIIAADTFVYIGVLGKCFSLIRRCLSPIGLLVFSVEGLNKSSIKLDKRTLESMVSSNNVNDYESIIEHDIEGAGFTL